MPYHSYFNFDNTLVFFSGMFVSKVINVEGYAAAHCRGDDVTTIVVAPL